MKRVQRGLWLAFALSVAVSCGRNETTNSDVERSLSQLSNWLMIRGEPSIRESMLSRVYFELLQAKDKGGPLRDRITGVIYSVDRDMLLIYGISQAKQFSEIKLFVFESGEVKCSQRMDLPVVERMSEEHVNVAHFVLALNAEWFPHVIDCIREYHDEELWVELFFGNGADSHRHPVVYFRETRTLAEQGGEKACGTTPPNSKIE